MRVFYTDGSFGSNGIKVGGWAIIEIANSEIIFEKFDIDPSCDVTNNKMELRAAIEASKCLSKGEKGIIHSDSQYVVRGISDWVKNWQKNNWQTAKKETVLNKDLWIELLEHTKNKEIQWVWVRGHANDEFNYRVDLLAKKSYTKPDEIDDHKVLMNKKNRQIVLKPNVSDLIYFNDMTKKYVVLLNDIRVGKSLGFFARLLSNSFGHELDFFPYDGEKFNILSSVSKKEKIMILHTIKQFKNNVNFQLEKLIE